MSAHERAGRGDEGTTQVPLDSLDPAVLLDQTPSGQIVIAMDGTLLFANAAFRKLVQLDKDAPLEPHCLQRFLAGGGAIFYETQFAPTLLMRGALNEISLELLRKDGTRVPVFINAILSRNNDTHPDTIIMAVFEARQRKQYENELLRARRELEQIAEVVRRSSDAILSLTADGIIQSWNSGAEHIFGFPASQIIGQPLVRLLAADKQAELRDAMARLESGKEVLLDTVGVRMSGNAVQVSVSLTPHLEAPGTLVAFSAIIRDITSRKMSERALIQNEKLASVGRLASSIAHEINNPLEAVTNLLYILSSHVTDEESKHLVTTAQDELARVSHIATHTLKFHKQSSNRTVLEVQSLVDSVLGLYRARLQNSGIEVINDCANVSPLCCFEGELRQVLVNIVSNAFDAMRSGGRLIVRARDITEPSSGTPGVRITVADSGSGMDADTLRHLFEAFFSTKGIGGTGLGMWITKDLVAKNEGTIKVRSKASAEKGGTVVSMFFPHRTDC